MKKGCITVLVTWWEKIWLRNIPPPNSIPLWQLTRICNGAHFYSPGVAEVILASTAFLQTQFGEDSHQDHDGHHPADDVHNHVSPIPLMFWLHLSVGGHWFSSVGPNWSVIVGAGGLIQSLLVELTAEPIEAGAATVQEDTCVTVKGRVPLAHDIIVTPTAGASGRHSVLFHLCRCGQSWRPLWCHRNQQRIYSLIGCLDVHISRSLILCFSSPSHDGSEQKM